MCINILYTRPEGVGVVKKSNNNITARIIRRLIGIFGGSGCYYEERARACKGGLRTRVEIRFFKDWKIARNICTHAVVRSCIKQNNII